MEKLASYRKIIQDTLIKYQQWATAANQPGIQQCLSFDERRDHYFWFHVGWHQKKRDFGVTVYIRLEQGKVWVEEDWTKQGIVNDFLEAGISPEDIVLGFHHPSKRALTEFATTVSP